MDESLFLIILLGKLFKIHRFQTNWVALLKYYFTGLNDFRVACLLACHVSKPAKGPVWFRSRNITSDCMLRATWQASDVQATPILQELRWERLCGTQQDDQVCEGGPGRPDADATSTRSSSDGVHRILLQTSKRALQERSAQGKRAEVCDEDPGCG